MSKLSVKPTAAVIVQDPLPLLMHMGCDKVTITYRAGGNEGVCLQSPEHGVQQLVGFNAAIGDFVGVDDILELTPAQVDLSDVANYITSAVANGSTTLYFDKTGQGRQGVPFAVLQGVSTTVAQLVADGGMKYQPDAISVAPAFDTPLTIRAAGLETVLLGHMEPGIGPQIINGFNPANACILELTNILNATTAHPDLSDITNFITVTNTDGNTILSVDPTGQGLAGTAFAVLQGVTLSLSQLLADNAIEFDPTKVTVGVGWSNMDFAYRSEGAETAVLPGPAGKQGPWQVANFSLTNGDAINVQQILWNANLMPAMASIGNYFSTVQSGGNTQLWFNSAGTGSGGNLEAVFLNTNVSIAQLVANSAIAYGVQGAPLEQNPVKMVMGCTKVTLTYRDQGNQGVCLQSPENGVQQLANFNPAAGDFIGVDDILEKTLAHNDLSDVAQYITSQAVNGGTMLYVDQTGQGLQGTPFAFLQGVTTTVAQLVADGGMLYVPDQVAIAPTFDTPFTIRPGGLETVLVGQLQNGILPEQISGFALGAGDNLELANILNKTLALPNLSNIAQFITVTDAGGNTTLSVDTTGHGLAGTPFAVLEGTSLSLSQLLAGNALTYDPTPTWTPAPLGSAFQFRAAGSEGAVLQNVGTNAIPATLAGFSLAQGDGIGVGNILSDASVQADLTNIENYFSTVETGGNTQIWFDPNGSGQGGTLEATLLNTSVTMTDLLSHSALHLT